jgi:hypothetical protein
MAIRRAWKAWQRCGSGSDDGWKKRGCKKHIFTCRYVDMYLGSVLLAFPIKARTPGSAPRKRGLAWVRSSGLVGGRGFAVLCSSEETGKAVRSGHSCAAVSHQSEPTARAANAGQSQFPALAGSEGEGRGCAPPACKFQISDPKFQMAPAAEVARVPGVWRSEMLDICAAGRATSAESEYPIRRCSRVRRGNFAHAGG